MSAFVTPMWFIAVLLSLLCIGVPLYYLSHGQIVEPKFRADHKDAAPSTYVVLGSLVAIPSLLATLVLVGGFLLPGLGLAKENRWTRFELRIPMRGTGPRQILTPGDIDVVLLMSTITFALSAMGGYLIWRGLTRYWARRPNNEEQH